MKKLLFMLVVTTTIVAAGCAYAFGTTQTVTVSAQVNPAFTMTLPSSGTVAFGTVSVGSVYTPASQNQTILVKSNKLWDYSVATSNITAGAASFPFSTFITDTGLAFGTGKPIGVTTDTRSYKLDLSSDTAYSIPANTPVSATVTYTAVSE